MHSSPTPSILLACHRIFLVHASSVCASSESSCCHLPCLNHLKIQIEQNVVSLQTFCTVFLFANLHALLPTFKRVQSKPKTNFRSKIGKLCCCYLHEFERLKITHISSGAVGSRLRHLPWKRKQVGSKDPKLRSHYRTSSLKPTEAGFKDAG